MEKCPKCNEYSVAYDGYRGVKRCIIDGCSCIVIDENSYSYLKSDPANNTVSRVMMIDGVEKEVLKTYDLL